MPSGVRARLLAALLVLLFVLLSGAPARAEEDAPRLDYAVGSDAAGCPSAVEFRSAVTARLGRDPFTAESSRTLRVEVRLEDGDLVATGALVEANGASSGLRRITGKPDGCREVIEGMALAVSLTFGALAESSAPPAATAAEADTKTPERPPSAPPRPPAPGQSEIASLAPTAERRDGTAVPAEPHGQGEALAAAVGLAGHAAAGVGPGVGVGGALLLRGRRNWWSLAVEGRLDGFGSTELETRGTVTTSLVAAVVAACGHRGILMLCPIGLAGSIRASSSGIRWPDSDAGPYVALGGRLGVEWPLSSVLRVQGRLDGFVTLLPVDIELDGQAVWNSPPGSVALGAGLLGTFR